MERDIPGLKMSLALSMQLDNYQQASSLAQKILTITPKDIIVLKVAQFLRKHKTDLMEKEEEIEEKNEVENCEEDGSEWESDCPSDFTGSQDQQQENDEEQKCKEEEKKEVLRRSCSRSKQISVIPSPTRTPSLGHIKKLEPRIIQPIRSTLLTKPIQILNFNSKDLSRHR